MIRKNSKGKITEFLKKLKKHNSAIAIGIVVFLIVTFFLFADRGFFHFYQTYNEKDNLQEEIDTLEQKKKALEEERMRLQNDPAYIEKIAREKYKMKKKDEKVYKIEMDKKK